MKKVYIQTHGCQMNEYDSKRMLDVCHNMEMQQVANPEDADLLLLNTCSIREKAQEKVFSELGRWRQLKQKRKGVVIGVAGCVASQEGEAILKRAPFVDLVFGPQTLHRLPALLNDHSKTGKSLVDISFPAIEKFDQLPKPNADGPTAYVTIMEGCSKYCSYCVVPYTRGEEISRSFEEVIVEVATLARQGVREITLLGQNVNAYRAPRNDQSIADLALLIQYVAEVPGIERIRFTTSHPVEFSDNLIAAYANVPKLANHLHLPVQSGSDRILSAMKRGHTALEYKAKIRKLRAVRPDISISSDFIVGFPGETEQDFEDTLQLVRDVDFDQSFSFIYSARPGTPASFYPDDVSLEIKKSRLQRLQDLLQQQAKQHQAKLLNKTISVLVAGAAKRGSGMLSGRTEDNRILNFAGPESLIGNLVKVLVTELKSNTLVGELVEYGYAET